MRPRLSVVRSVLVSVCVPIVAWAAIWRTPISGQSRDTSTANLALVGGRIYVSPSEAPIPNGIVLVRDGVIAAVGPRGRVRVPATTATIDCTGSTIVAGFWNSHVHFFERKWERAEAIPAAELGRQLQDMTTRYGFTSVFDLGSSWENTRRIRDRIESGEVPGPRIRSTGEGLLAPGAMPPPDIIRMLGSMVTPSPTIADAAQATAASSALLKAGVDGIKVHLQPPPKPNAPIPDSAIEAAVVEAHRVGKPVFVHPNDRADVLRVVKAGVDVIAHTTARSPWDDAVIAAMKEGRVALTPTLTIWRYLFRHERLSMQEEQVTQAIAELRAWVGVGGTVLFGNDLGAVEYDPREEYALMAAAGMTFPQILAALTTAPAERFGASQQVGRIATGLQADLVVLQGDPSKTIEALGSVRYTVRAGKIVFRAGA
jgi:imidazolonepropionase-like amidohydrolase